MTNCFQHSFLWMLQVIMSLILVLADHQKSCAFSILRLQCDDMKPVWISCLALFDPNADICLTVGAWVATNSTRVSLFQIFLTFFFNCQSKIAKPFQVCNTEMSSAGLFSARSTATSSSSAMSFEFLHATSANAQKQSSVLILFATFKITCFFDSNNQHVCFRSPPPPDLFPVEMRLNPTLFDSRDSQKTTCCWLQHMTGPATMMKQTENMPKHAPLPPTSFLPL